MSDSFNLEELMCIL